jgi:hypothetical protein
MKRIAAMGIALALTLSGTAAAEDSFVSGRWNGQAFFDSGRFTHCGMYADYVSRWKLLFSIDRMGDVNLGFSREDLMMYPWESASIWMQIDNDPVLIRSFKTVKPQLVVTTFASGSDWIKKLRKGKKLKVNVGKRVPNFDLAGFDAAMTQLFSCAAKHRKS